MISQQMRELSQMGAIVCNSAAEIMESRNSLEVNIKQIDNVGFGLAVAYDMYKSMD
jgi:hypothetical protein